MGPRATVRRQKMTTTMVDDDHSDGYDSQCSDSNGGKSIIGEKATDYNIALICAFDELIYAAVTGDKNK